jgi:hypothetical protein
MKPSSLRRHRRCPEWWWWWWRAREDRRSANSAFILDPLFGLHLVILLLGTSQYSRTKTTRSASYTPITTHHDTAGRSTQFSTPPPRRKRDRLVREGLRHDVEYQQAQPDSFHVFWSASNVHRYDFKSDPRSNNQRSECISLCLSRKSRPHLFLLCLFSLEVSPLLSSYPTTPIESAIYGRMLIHSICIPRHPVYGVIYDSIALYNAFVAVVIRVTLPPIIVHDRTLHHQMRPAFSHCIPIHRIRCS